MNSDFFFTSFPFLLFHHDCHSLPSHLVISVPKGLDLEEELSYTIYSLAAFDECWFGWKQHFESFIIIW